MPQAAASVQNIPFMHYISNNHQLRVLLCEGPALLAWVDDAPASVYAPVEEQRQLSLRESYSLPL